MPPYLVRVRLRASVPDSGQWQWRDASPREPAITHGRVSVWAGSSSPQSDLRRHLGLSRGWEAAQGGVIDNGCACNMDTNTHMPRQGQSCHSAVWHLQCTCYSLADESPTP